MEVLLIGLGLLLGLAGAYGLLGGFLLAFLAVVLAARAAPERELLEGLHAALWVLLPMAAAWGSRAGWSRLGRRRRGRTGAVGRGTEGVEGGEAESG